MTILYDAYIALLSGLTHKTGNEIHWQDEYGTPITIESIDIEQCKYMIRYYYENGQKRCEEEWKNGQRHGKLIDWHKNGQKWHEAEYQNGQLHGKNAGWNRNGEKRWEVEFEYGKLIKK